VTSKTDQSLCQLYNAFHLFTVQIPFSRNSTKGTVIRAEDGDLQWSTFTGITGYVAERVRYYIRTVRS